MKTKKQGRNDNLRLRAERGSSDAQFELGSEIEDDNPEEAAEWYRLAAEQDYIEAQVELARLYEEGLGVPKNDAAAFRWNLRAAQMGNTMAYLNVGRSYVQGIGVEANQVEAIKWLTHIVNPSNSPDRWCMPRGQFWIGLAYAMPSQRNLVEAYKWLNLAATCLPSMAKQDAVSRETAIDARNFLTKQMTAEQVHSAQQLSADLFSPRNLEKKSPQ